MGLGVPVLYKSFVQKAFLSPMVTFGKCTKIINFYIPPNNIEDQIIGMKLSNLLGNNAIGKAVTSESFFICRYP